jgi:AbrB family looped-hinge helix DNA binding protein
MEKKTINFYKSRLRAKGQVTVPSEIRTTLDLNEGDDLAFYINESGQVVVDRLQTIPPDQVWFWTERWQQMEREAQADIEAGKVHRFSNVDDAIAHLQGIANVEE